VSGVHSAADLSGFRGRPGGFLGPKASVSVLSSASDYGSRAKVVPLARSHVFAAMEGLRFSSIDRMNLIVIRGSNSLLQPGDSLHPALKLALLHLGTSGLSFHMLPFADILLSICSFRVASRSARLVALEAWVATATTIVTFQWRFLPRPFFDGEVPPGQRFVGHPATD
jgi:hypothetical protein